MAKNKNLSEARKNKNDEFYTPYSEVKEECDNYKEYFKDKIIYCNCDNYQWSNFVKYFQDNFEEFGLKKLIATNYAELPNLFEDKQTEKSYLYIKTKDTEEIKELAGNGDFRSPECIEQLKECDIVVTNPPFSLFRAFVDVLEQYKKDYLVINTFNAIAYKNIFPLIKDNKIRLGYKIRNFYFYIPKYNITAKNVNYDENGIPMVALNNACWVTTLPVNANRELHLEKSFRDIELVMYDNYCAWNIDKVKNIPKEDYIEVEVTEEEYKRLKEFYKDDCILLEDTDEVQNK